MPKRRAAWSAWNYLGTSAEIAMAASKGRAAESKPVFVTYWLNKVRPGLPGSSIKKRGVDKTLATVVVQKF